MKTDRGSIPGRLVPTEAGHVLLELRHRWGDGTTHLLFEPLELLGRLAALTPRPRINLVLYYGVLGARSAWRARLGGPGGATPAPLKPGAGEPCGRPPAPRRLTNLLWAQLMARSFGVDVLACPRCGDCLHLIALIERRAVTERILAHLGLPTAMPAPHPPRAPPLRFGPDGGRLEDYDRRTTRYSVHWRGERGCDDLALILPIPSPAARPQQPPRGRVAYVVLKFSHSGNVDLCPLG